MASAKKCKICVKTVYPMDPQINLDGSIFHKPCAKCADCNCQITISNFCKNESGEDTLLLCNVHYFKRFHEGGAYLGGEKFLNKSVRDMAAANYDPTSTAVTASANASSPTKAAVPEEKNNTTEPTPVVEARSPKAVWPPKSTSADTEAEVPIRENKPTRKLRGWPPSTSQDASEIKTTSSDTNET
eukprot:gene6422-8839_t